MGLGLRGRICGLGWGRAPAPPSSAEGERCGGPGPNAAAAGGGTAVGEGRVPGRGKGAGRLWEAGARRRPRGRWVEGWCCGAGDSCGDRPWRGVRREPTPVGGEPSGESRNRVLELQTPARIAAWVCRGDDPCGGGLGMAIRGWGCRDLVLGVWDLWGTGVGRPSAPVEAPGVPRGEGAAVRAGKRDPGCGWGAPDKKGRLLGGFPGGLGRPGSPGAVEGSQGSEGRRRSRPRGVGGPEGRGPSARPGQRAAGEGPSRPPARGGGGWTPPGPWGRSAGGGPRGAEAGRAARPGAGWGARREMRRGRAAAGRPGGGSALASGSLYCVSDPGTARRGLSGWPSAAGVTP